MSTTLIVLWVYMIGYFVSVYVCTQYKLVTEKKVTVSDLIVLTFISLFSWCIVIIYLWVRYEDESWGDIVILEEGEEDDDRIFHEL